MTGEPSGELTAAELLRRLSGTLRNDIGPAVGDEFTRTQAFMASVILERLSKQVALEPGHRAAEQADMADLHARLAEILGEAPAEVTAARATAAAAGTVAALGPLVRALYAWGAGDGAAADALATIRPALRSDIDRRMEIAT
jgi:AcrR family transcriptional regulator